MEAIIKPKDLAKYKEASEQFEKNKGKRTKNFCICIIGTTRTGKSSTTRGIIEKWRANNENGKVLAFDPQFNFGENSEHGLPNLVDKNIFAHDKSWDRTMVDYCAKNVCTLVVLDDYRMINRNHTPAEGLVELMYLRAKLNIDVIFICHSPALVLNFLTYYINYYYIFFTKHQQGSFEKKIPDYELCDSAVSVINGYVKVYGTGSYPDFPHIVVNTDTDSIIAKNIDKEKLNQITGK